MAVAIAPATEMCGSEARLCSATPSAASGGASSPYVSPAPHVTVAGLAVDDDLGRPGASSETSSAESAMSVNECLEPSACTRGARGTIARSSSSVAGRCSAAAR